MRMENSYTNLHKKKRTETKRREGGFKMKNKIKSQKLCRELQADSSADNDNDDEDDD